MDEGPLHIVDDETRPLLDVDNQRTPLPKLQLAIILLLEGCEPITTQSIYPYINHLIAELDITGGDDRKVGYYAGLIASLFYATEAIAILQWNRLSDYSGRKPVLLIGLLGTIFPMLAFGLSRTFWALVISRCLTGLLNGNAGVIKSVMGELTDSTNRPQAFALLPAAWCFGATIGPLIGGSLSHPHERFPKAFPGLFWKDYPYFLPCLVGSAYVSFAFLITFVMLKEPLPALKSRQSSLEPRNGSTGHSNDEPLPLQKILVYPVILSVANNAALSFLSIALYALLPLFLSMPLDIGGLNLSPLAIGYIMGTFGIVDAIFQAFFLSPIVGRWGKRNVFIAAVSTFIPAFLTFPVINFVARGWGQWSLGVWVLLGFLIALLTLTDMAFGVILIFITASAPNKRSLGATNGLSQTSASIARAIGPALSTSFFSFSVEKNILGGLGVYVAFATLSVFAVYLATRLPSELWKQHEPEPIMEDD